MRKGAVELVALAPDVVLAASVPIVLALQQVSRTVPIVFAAAIDPVGAGLVASLARPGGNATGFTMFEYGISAKWLELLKEISPGVKRVAVLREPTVAGIGQLAAMQTAAPSLGVELQPIDARDVSEFERVLADFGRYAERWSDCALEHVRGDSPHADYSTGGSAPITGGLSWPC
jgi:putative ABC transport system substrate-binding protein